MKINYMQAGKYVLGIVALYLILDKLDTIIWYLRIIVNG